jgi:hypothetical protein
MFLIPWFISQNIFIEKFKTQKMFHYIIMFIFIIKFSQNYINFQSF